MTWFCWLHQTMTLAVGMRVSTSRSETVVLCRTMMDCSLWVGSELLPHVKEFKYLRVLFTSEGKVECDKQIAVLAE